VFVAMKFSADMFDVFDEAIKPALAGCGFNAFTVNHEKHNNDINDAIIAGIKSSKFMIADFTYNSHGVYFEAGYAQGRGLEVFRTCKKEWYDGLDEKCEKNRLHFDVEHYNFIMWQNHDDLMKQLKDKICAIIPDVVITDDNRISDLEKKEKLNPL
jgi:nucleoside 2-deoxyribosyltransferase